MSSCYLFIHPFIYLFRDKVSHNHDWALTYCVTKHDLEHLVLLPPPTEEYGMYHHTWSAWCWISNPELPEYKANHLLTDLHSQLHHVFLNAKHLTQHLRCESLMDFLSPAKWGVQVPYQLKMVCVPSYGELFPFSLFLLVFTMLCLYFITFF